MSDSPLEGPSTWELLNDELRYRLDVQRTAGERLETKAAVFLGASLTAMQFVARDQTSSGYLPWAVGAYVLAAAAALTAVLPRRSDETGPRAMLRGVWLWSRANAAGELANNRLRAYEQNVPRQARRVLGLRVSIALLALGAILSVAHFARGESTNVGRPAAPAASRRAHDWPG